MIMNYIILQVMGLQSTTAGTSSPTINLAGFDGIAFSTELLIIGVVVLLFFWLYHTYFVVPRLNGKQPERKKTNITAKDTQLNLNDASDVTDEISVVIGLALHLYKKQLSDYEKARLTIARVSRTYSPWSSKIYGLRQNPRR